MVTKKKPVVKKPAVKKSAPTKRAPKTLYTKELAETICERLAAGESLISICRDPNMPSDWTVRKWALDGVDGFDLAYARARDLGYDRVGDELIALADETRIGTITTVKPNGVETKTADMVERARLQIETRKWVLERMLPKKYGNKVQTEHSGGLRIETISDAELEAIVRRGK